MRHLSFSSSGGIVGFGVLVGTGVLVGIGVYVGVKVFAGVGMSVGVEIFVGSTGEDSRVGCLQDGQRQSASTINNASLDSFNMITPFTKGHIFP